MTTRIGINGFGRMGRLAVRALQQQPDLQLVHVNEAKGGVETAAHLLEFDSVHGRYSGTVSVAGEAMRIDGRDVSFSAHTSPADIPWGDLGVDVVIESTGKFRTPELLEPHFARGAHKVVVAAPVKSPEVLNVVMGCNDHLYDPSVHRIVTAASCTTNCLAPVVKVIHEALGIRHGQITTIHDPTNTNLMVDAPHKDLRRARSAMLSLAPTTTGSATAIALIYPELKGKLNGHAVRAPVLNASLTDCVFELKRETSAEEVNRLFAEAAKGPLAGILGYEDRPLVSADYARDTRSSIVDALSTMVTDGTMLKVYAWYDNEMGYACRMVDLACHMQQQGI
jgi:glyceraldehyde 3-phosphate dehydrogenase